MANTMEPSENIAPSRLRYYSDENGAFGSAGNYANNLRIGEIKSMQPEQIKATFENMKGQTPLSRTKSNEKITPAAYGSTGGSQPPQTAQTHRKPQLRLNTNLTNLLGQAAIAVPHSTTNAHSSRMQNYQQPTPTNLMMQQQVLGANSQNFQTSTNRSGTYSTPKAIPTMSSNGTANYSSALLLQNKIRAQNSSSNSQLKQGLKGSQGVSYSLGNSNVSSSALIGNQSIDKQPTIIQPSNQMVNVQQLNSSASNKDIVKVGTSVPKTTVTTANLKNYNNIRQFSQLLNSQSRQQSQIQNQSQGDDSQKNIGEEKSFLSGDQRNGQGLLSNHQKHLLQQTKNLFTKQMSQKNIDDSQQVNGGSVQKLNPKNLQINIPSSPRNNDQQSKTDQQKNDNLQKSNGIQQTLQQPHIHQGSLSTTNANAGNIKLSKFTCNSTRHDTQKPNIFSNNNASKKIHDDSKTQTKDISSQQVVVDMNNPDSIPLQPAHKIIIPNHESTKHSLKRNGVVRAYAANTNQGLVRNYNEDRVSIILNILKPPNRQIENWPRCSFFGIYDGHGGAACADFLRDNLHQFVIKEQSFPSNPKEALEKGFANAERKFIELSQNENGIIDKSGSCAIVILIVEDMCYVANVGDSRAVLSSEQGKKIYPLSRDHKPNDDLERKRIIEAGGQIYHRTATNTDMQNPHKKELIVGPLRVLPGRLSVSRTFGDIEAKLSKYNGNPNVVIATPEIKSFRITKDHDFIVLGCDGIFDKLNNKDVIQCVWNSVHDNKNLGFAQNIHKQSGMGVEYILKNSLLRRTLDNVTVVLIAFNNFKHAAFGQSSVSKAIYSRHNASKQDSSRGVVNNSNISTDNSQLVQSTVGKKENIPPQSQGRSNSSSTKQLIQSHHSSQHQLSINTNGQCATQGLKTTTNAQLQRDGQISTGQKKASMVIPSYAIIGNNNATTLNSKQRHFDFSNV